jgi:U2-associated protein SR140
LEGKVEDEIEEEKDEEDPDLDGIPLDGAALIKGALLRGISDNNSRSSLIQDNQNEDNDEDIDGMPCKFEAFHCCNFENLIS